MTRYQKGTYGLSLDLRESRQMGMQLSRDLSTWKKIAELYAKAHQQQDQTLFDEAAALYQQASAK